MFKVPKTISLGWHLIVKIPLYIQLLILLLDEVETTGEVYILLSSILQYLRSIDQDIRDAGRLIWKCFNKSHLSDLLKHEAPSV